MTDFAPENFPLYELIQSLNLPGADTANKDFEAARDGGDKERYGFAMGLYTIATMPDLVGKMPGLTPELQKDTLKQVAAIFEDAATRDHPNAALMTAFMKAAGQGTPQDLSGAKTWLDRAEALGGKSDFTKQLRQKISTVYIVVPPPAKKPPTP